MFKLTKKRIIVSLATFCLLTSFHQSKSMITPIGPYNFLLNKMIKNVISVTSKSISTTISTRIHLSKYLLKKYRFSGCKNNQEKLERAITYNYPKIVKELLKHPKIDVNKAPESGQHKGMTPLYVACGHGYLDIVKELLKHPKIDINKAPESGQYKGITPLFIACYYDRLDIAKELLKLPNINVNKTPESDSYKDKTPLGLTLDLGRLQIAKILLKHKNIDVNKIYKHYEPDYEMPPLSFAIFGLSLEMTVEMKKDFEQIVKELLKHKDIDVNKAPQSGENKKYTPLFCACITDQLQKVKLLLQNDTKIDNISKKIALNKQKINRYITLVEKYNKPDTNKLKFILSKKENTEIFSFLVKLAFGKFIRAIKDKITNKPIEPETTFFKLYKNEKINFKKIFGVPYKKNLGIFIKEVFESENNCFGFLDKSMLKQITISKNLSKIRKNKNYTDLIVKF
ncbi:ankyrin repeat domain-containing protein [Candidatus Dependentiae bacterium]